jgi:hypothetical protein
MTDTHFHTDYLAKKAIVNVKLDEPKAPAQNGSVVVFRDEATLRSAAALMGRQGPGDIDVMNGHKYTFPKKGGGTITLYGLHYDNVKRDREDIPETPADVIERVTPTVSIVAKNAGDPAVKDAIENFLRARQQEKH